MPKRTFKVTVEFYERFFAQVQKYSTGAIQDHWIWLGTFARNGYGVIRLDNKLQLAHRISYQMYKGEIPSGYEIDHWCMTKRCVNPQHLQAVPSAVNTRRGKLAKLSGADVRAIRARYVRGVVTQEQLAKEFGVHPAHISRLVNQRLWTKMHARFERE